MGGVICPKCEGGLMQVFRVYVNPRRGYRLRVRCQRCSHKMTLKEEGLWVPVKELPSKQTT